MSDTTSHRKPPTQVAGVQGFDAFAGEPDKQLSRIELLRLIALPPFQMFMMETHQRDPQWVVNPRNYFTAYSLNGLNDLAREYIEWHAAKGLWPRENAWGELLEREP